MLALTLCLALEGCAATARLYPKQSDERRNLHDTLVAIKPGKQIIVRMSDGSRTAGRFCGVTSAPDSVLVLSGGKDFPCDSTGAESLSVAEIEYVGERQGWTRPVQIIIAGAFLAVVALAVVGGETRQLVPTR